MFARFTRLALAASLATATFLPTLALARAPIAPCALLTSVVTDVKPHEVQEHHGKVIVTRLDGASLFVPAQPGVTAEWLERSLTEHVTKMKSAVSMPDCPLEASALSVSVRPAGGGYWVTIQAHERDQAKLVLERATALLKHHSA